MICCWGAWGESALCVFEFCGGSDNFLEIVLHSSFSLEELLFEFDFELLRSGQPSCGLVDSNPWSSLWGQGDLAG